MMPPLPMHRERDGVTGALRGRHILLAEDEALIAMDLEHALTDAGSRVIGPAASLPQALQLFGDAARIDAAILDVELCGEEVFPLAEILAARFVPLVFHTALERHARMERFLPLARICPKPMAIEHVLGTLADLLTVRDRS